MPPPRLCRPPAPSPAVSRPRSPSAPSPGAPRRTGVRPGAAYATPAPGAPLHGRPPGLPGSPAPLRRPAGALGFPEADRVGLRGGLRAVARRRRAVPGPGWSSPGAATADRMSPSTREGERPPDDRAAHHARSDPDASPDGARPVDPNPEAEPEGDPDDRSEALRCPHRPALAARRLARPRLRPGPGPALAGPRRGGPGHRPGARRHRPGGADVVSRRHRRHRPEPVPHRQRLGDQRRDRGRRRSRPSSPAPPAPPAPSATA